jgi:hypothetical protein
MADAAGFSLAASLWSAERELWLDGLSALKRHADPESCLARPDPWDALEPPAAMSPGRWTEVAMRRPRLERPRPDVTVIAYHADAVGEGGAVFSGPCASTYVSDGGRWRLVAHARDPR